MSSNPDNTLRNELREIVLNLDLGYEYAMSDYASSKKQEAEYEAKGLAEVDQAVDAILSAIKNRLPKEAEQMREPYGNFVEGWNAYRQGVKQALDIEGES